jgi:hypothetical protein
MAEAIFSLRRSNPRFLFSADAEVTLPDGTHLAAQIFELSSRGCYIDTVKALPTGTTLRLHICHGKSECELSAKVIYMQPGFGMGVFGMGVVFEDMAKEQSLAIESWLRDLAEEQTAKSPD